jgi:hypothetical protein
MSSIIITDNEEQLRISKAEKLRREAKERLIMAEEEARLAEEEAIKAEEEARILKVSRLAEEARVLEEARLAEELCKAQEEARILEEARLAEELRVLKELHKAEEEVRILNESRLAEEARLVEEARLREEILLSEKKRICMLNNIAEEKRITYEEHFDIIVSQYTEKLINIEEDIKLVGNAHQYTSNVLLNFAAGLCKKIHTDQSHVNPLLRELSGYMVSYYQEQTEIPAKLIPSVRLDAIEKDIDATAKEHIELNDNNYNKIEKHIGEIKHLRQQYQLNEKRLLEQISIIEQKIRQHNHSVLREEQIYIDTQRTLLRNRQHPEHFQYDKQKQLNLQIEQDQQRTMLRDQKIKEQNLIQENLNQQLLQLKEKQKNDTLHLKIKEFIEFEMTNTPNNIQATDLEAYIQFRIDDYDTQQNIQKKWIVELMRKLEPLRKIIVELRKLVKRQTDEYHDTICNTILKNNENCSDERITPLRSSKFYVPTQERENGRRFYSEPKAKAAVAPAVVVAVSKRVSKPKCVKQ